MAITNALKQDHERLKSLIGEINESDDADRITELLSEFADLLTAHSKAEEKVVYDALIERGDEDDRELGHEGYVEHESADSLLEKMKHSSNRTDPPWQAKATVLKEMLEHHIEEEEDELFEKLRSNFSEEERARMAERFEELKRERLDG